jgi:hypothetical protein
MPAMVALTTLLTLAKLKNTDDVVGIVEEASRAVPELSGMQIIGSKETQIAGVAFARTIPGLNYKTVVRTALPTVDFRHANQGVTNTTSSYEEKEVQTFILNAKHYLDKAIADPHPDGPSGLMAIEMAGLVEAAYQKAARCMYYGQNTTFGSAKAYPGFLAALDSSMTVDAGGTTDNVASSVWAVRWGVRDVAWVMGNEGKIPLSDMDVRDALDASSNPFTAYHQELTNNLGVQVLSKYSIGRIKKLTTETGKGLTDLLLSDLYAKFPVGKGPNALYMSRRSLMQLQKSRTATSESGKEADMPTNWQGIPIFATDMISETETLAL